MVLAEKMCNVIKQHPSAAEAAHWFCVWSQGWEYGCVIALLGNCGCGGVLCFSFVVWIFCFSLELASLRP